MTVLPNTGAHGVGEPTERVFVATKANRGTKRQCLNEDCKAPFYDLNRDPIACPVCGSVFEPVATVAFEPEAVWKTAPKMPRPSFYGRRPAVIAEAAPDVPDVAAEEAPGDETPETEVPAVEADTLLELEEEPDADTIAVPSDDDKN